MRKVVTSLIISSLIISSLIISSLLILLLCHYAGAESWEQVVTNGFGEASNDYAWSMAAFKGKIYIGTLNFFKGGEIWRSSTGDPDDWQKVYNSPSSLFSNIGVRNLYVDGDEAMYACTVNSNGAEILRTTNGQRWIPVENLGKRDNAAFRCMVRFGDYLYAGAGSNEAQLYRSKNGFNWQMVNANPSFTSTKVFDPNAGSDVTNNTMIGELEVFNDQLYVFTWTREVKYQDIVEQMLGLTIEPSRSNLSRGNSSRSTPSAAAFEVWRSKDGVNWEKVVGKDDAYGNGMGLCLRDPDAGLDNDAIISTTVFRDQLYVGTLNSNADTAIWRTSDGTQWTKVLDFFDLGEKANYYVWRMIPFQDKLFIGTMNVGPSKENPDVTGSQIWASYSGDPGTFYNLVHNGFDGETWSDGANIEIPKNIGIRTFGIFHDTLFAGTATIISTPITKRQSDGETRIAGRDIGCEVWRIIPDTSSSLKSKSSPYPLKMILQPKEEKAILPWLL